MTYVAFVLCFVVSLETNGNKTDVIQTDRRAAYGGKDRERDRIRTNAKVILLCTRILSLTRGRRGVFNETTIEIDPMVGERSSGRGSNSSSSNSGSGERSPRSNNVITLLH